MDVYQGEITIMYYIFQEEDVNYDSIDWGLPTEDTDVKQVIFMIRNYINPNPLLGTILAVNLFSALA